MALKVGELYSVLSLDTKGYMKNLNSARLSTEGMSNMLKIGLAGAAVTAGYALYKMARSGLENMKELDNAMKMFQVETGASAAEVEEMRDVVQRLHKTNTDSYEDLGNAVTRLQQRHGKATEEMTQSFLNYSKVLGIDTADAIDGVTNLLNAYGKELSESAEIMDKLYIVTQRTGAPINELHKALQRTAPALRAMGMELEDGIALFGAMAEQGANMSQAQMGLNAFLRYGQNPTKKQAEAMMALGVAMKETEDGYRLAGDAGEGFLAMIETLANNADKPEVVAAALEILGSRAGGDLINAFKGGEGSIRDLMAALQESEGVVQKASDVYDKQLGERWELIRRQYLEPFLEWMGDKLLRVLENVAAFVEKWGPRVMKVFEMVGRAIDAINSAVDRLVGGFQGLFEGGKNAISSWGDGIREGATNAVDAVKGVAQRVARFLKGESPPPEGPLSDVDVGGRRVIEAWADGMLMAEGYLRDTVGHLGQIAVSEMEQVNEQVTELQAGYEDWFSTLESGFMSAITGGRELSDVLKDIAKQLANKWLQQLLFGQGGLFGGLFGSLFHSGGIVGKEGVKARLPRYHSGGLVGTNEQLAVLKKGEGVFTSEQMKAMGGDQVHVTMNVNAVDAQSFIQLARTNKGVFESLIIENLMRDGAIRKAIKGVT